MSIKLDWEVESDGGWSEIGEDAAALAARKRQAQRARTVVIILLAVGLVVGGVVGYRLYTADQQARAELRATVAAETAAIRIGDSSAYLDIQQNVGSWRQMQAERFGQYQAQSGHVKAEGEIVTLDMDGGKGRVVVREVVDDKPYNVVWFYQHSDEGWRHVPPEIAFWGWPRDNISPHYKFSYWDEDAAFAAAVQDRLEGWWEHACRLTGCRSAGGVSPDFLKVRIEPDPLLQIGWAAYDPETLRVPSPLLGRVPADGALDPELERALAGYVAEHWSRKLIGTPPDDFGDMAWAQDEFQSWLVSSFIPDAPPAPILGPLAETSGPQAVMALLGLVKQNDDVVNAARTVTGAEPGDLPFVWDRYLTYRLRAEAALLDGNHATEAIVLYRDPERLIPNALSGTPPEIAAAMPGSIEVTSTRRVGDLLWAETRFKRARSAVDRHGVVIESIMTHEPFRLVGGRWVHTVPLDTDYGDRLEEQSQHIQLGYRTIDAPTVEGLLTDLEQQYMTVVTDLALTQQPNIILEMSPFVYSNAMAISPQPGRPVESPEGVKIWIGSPYSTAYPADVPLREALRGELSRALVVHLVSYEASTLSSDHPLVVAIIQWELKHLGLDTTGLTPELYTQAATPPASLDAEWAEARDGPTRGEVYIGASVLIDLIVEKQGPQALPPLLQNLSSASSMEDWLSRSVGLHALDLEPGWKLRLRAALSQSQ